MSLTKKQISNHNEVMKLVNADRELTFNERVFVLENYHESATTMNRSLGAFFTPSGLARDFTLDVHGNKLIDLCAGIGMLSFWIYHYASDKPRITCVEYNREYYEVGKRVLPEATWILGDALTVELDTDYDMVYSNPPFGVIKTSDASKLLYKGSNFEYKIIERGSHIAKYGLFIIPQASSGFMYSGEQTFKINKDAKYSKFVNETGIVLEPGCGVDTSQYKNDWNGVSIICEIVSVDYVE